MKDLTVTFSPMTVEPEYLRAMGEAILAAQWQMTRVAALATVGAQMQLLETISRAMVSAQLGILDAMCQATSRRD